MTVAPIQERGFGQRSNDARGRSIKGGTHAQVSVYMTLDELDALKARAKRNNRSLSNQARFDMKRGSK